MPLERGTAARGQRRHDATPTLIGRADSGDDVAEVVEIGIAVPDEQDPQFCARLRIDTVVRLRGHQEDSCSHGDVKAFHLGLRSGADPHDFSKFIWRSTARPSTPYGL